MTTPKLQTAETTLQRIRRSILPGPLLPKTDRERGWVVFNTLVLHLRPIRVPAPTLRFTHTFGLGGSSLVLVGVLMGSGLLMMFAYEPAPGAAWDSVARMQDEVLFGRLVRAVHHLSANLLIAVAFLHLLRVFFTGGFHGPRRFNWIVGLALLSGIVAANFTGYLLPWDQLSYWAVTISTGMLGYVPLVGEGLRRALLGGAEIGSATLVNFYALHTTVVPVTLIGLMAWHFWRVRKAGGVVVPPWPGQGSERPEMVLFLPNLLMREVAAALVLVGGVFLVSVFLEAPLGERANPGMSPNPAKAPWYFLGFQELLLHLHPVFAILIVPGLAAAALVALPYLRYANEQGGPWFLSERGRRTAGLAAFAAALVTPAWVLLDEYLLGPGGWLPGAPAAVARGLVPTAVMAGAAAGVGAVARRRFGATTGEVVQAVFSFLVVGFAVLTATGIWFRGEGMRLVWPWGR